MKFFFCTKQTEKSFETIHLQMPHGLLQADTSRCSNSSRRQTRAGATQALVDRHIPVQHKSTCRETDTSRYSTGRDSCRQTRPGKAQAVVGRHLLVHCRLLNKAHVQVQHRLSGTDTSRCSTKALLERHVHIQHRLK
jgi:hypothetical protein